VGEEVVRFFHRSRKENLRSVTQLLWFKKGGEEESFRLRKGRHEKKVRPPILICEGGEKKRRLFPPHDLYQEGKKNWGPKPVRSVWKKWSFAEEKKGRRRTSGRALSNRGGGESRFLGKEKRSALIRHSEEGRKGGGGGKRSIPSLAREGRGGHKRGGEGGPLFESTCSKDKLIEGIKKEIS